MPFEVKRYHDICAGHRVHGHESKCAHLHGHNYRFHFSVEAQEGDEELDRIGRVIDFSMIKSQLCDWLESNWDHKFLLWDQDPAADAMRKLDPKGVVLVPFNPTAENMAQHLVEVIGPIQLRDYGVVLVEVHVEETAKCSASYWRTK